MDKRPDNKFQITKGSKSLRLREILMDSDGLLTIVKLNFLFLITIAPVIPFITVFTAGPSITALLYCSNHVVKTGNLQQIGKTYFDIFRSSFKRTVKIGFAVTVLNYLFIAGLAIYITMASENYIFIPFASASLIGIIILWSISIHLFPAFSENSEDKTIKERIADAASLAVINIKSTLIAVVVSLAVIGTVILMLPKTLPLVFFVMFSVPALAAGFAHTDPEFISDII